MPKNPLAVSSDFLADAAYVVVVAKHRFHHVVCGSLPIVRVGNDDVWEVDCSGGLCGRVGRADDTGGLQSDCSRHGGDIGDDALPQ